jgi:VIT1/CCC1 family predicted Fe2+/Mn2+ transporter
MRSTFKKGLGYGLTSGIITTLGLMVGLNSSTQSMKVVIGGILIIAIADALSDALGIHISEEAEGDHTQKEVWEATIATFLAKFVFALMFVIPIIILPLKTAIISSILFGIVVIGIFSYLIAKDQGENPLHVVFEHITIAILVILSTNYIGIWIGNIL